MEEDGAAAREMEALQAGAAAKARDFEVRKKARLTAGGGDQGAAGVGRGGGARRGAWWGRRGLLRRAQQSRAAQQIIHTQHASDAPSPCPPTCPGPRLPPLPQTARGAPSTRSSAAWWRPVTWSSRWAGPGGRWGCGCARQGRPAAGGGRRSGAWPFPTAPPAPPPGAGRARPRGLPLPRRRALRALPRPQQACHPAAQQDG
jgi:hypothetical protein